MENTHQKPTTGGQTPKRTKIGCIIAIVIIAIIVAIPILIGLVGILSAAIFPVIGNSALYANMTAMGIRAEDIYVGIRGANAERIPLGLGSIWPRAGENMGTRDDIDINEMTFANSSDYFTVLLDGRNYATPKWAPYVMGLDYSKLSGVGVQERKRRGRLTAENNAWTIAANITDDMPDIIPFIISRNIDPASLIPRVGDLSKQRIRPSKEFTTPFGPKGFVLVSKDGEVFRCTGKHANLHTLYQGVSREELQEVRDTLLLKIEYLTP